MIARTPRGAFRLAMLDRDPGREADNAIRVGEKRDQLGDRNCVARLLHQAFAGMAADERVGISECFFESSPSRFDDRWPRSAIGAAADLASSSRRQRDQKQLVARRRAELTEQVERTDPRLVEFSRGAVTIVSVQQLFPDPGLDPAYLDPGVAE